MNTITNGPGVTKPNKTVVPVHIGLHWGVVGGFIHQEKMDGRFATRETATGGLLAGELMADGIFWAFDCLADAGSDLRPFPYSLRLQHLAMQFDSGLLPVNFRLLPTFAHGGELLANVLRCGGEGVVRKSLSAPWGVAMEACKRLETFLCIVTDKGESQSVSISRIVDSMTQAVPCGHVPLRSGKYEQVRIGSVIKCEGFGLTAAGMLREPRLCKDSPGSWLVTY